MPGSVRPTWQSTCSPPDCTGSPPTNGGRIGPRNTVRRSKRSADRAEGGSDQAMCGNCAYAWEQCPCLPTWLRSDARFQDWVDEQDLTQIVRFLRKHTDLTQTQLGAVLGGLRQSTISKINSGALLVQDRRTLHRALERFRCGSHTQVSSPPPRESSRPENITWETPHALASLDAALTHHPTRRAAMALTGTALATHVKIGRAHVCT